MPATPHFAQKLSIGIAIVAALAFAAWKLGMAPLYAANSATDCLDKYRSATTQQETTHVDGLPSKDSASGRRTKCGLMRRESVVLSR